MINPLSELINFLFYQFITKSLPQCTGEKKEIFPSTINRVRLVYRWSSQTQPGQPVRCVTAWGTGAIRLHLAVISTLLKFDWPRQLLCLTMKRWQETRRMHNFNNLFSAIIFFSVSHSSFCSLWLISFLRSLHFYLSPTRLCHFISFSSSFKTMQFLPPPNLTRMSVSSSPPSLLCFSGIKLILHENTRHIVRGRNI